MKKYTFLAVLAITVFACNNPSSTEVKPVTVEDVPTVEAPEAEVSAAVASNPDYIKGLALVQKSDCLGCHKVNETSIGPSYADIAGKYESSKANIALLAGKIMQGGQGVWGQTPMAPHPGLSNDDAEQMVKYILLLKGEKK